MISSWDTRCLIGGSCSRKLTERRRGVVALRAHRRAAATGGRIDSTVLDSDGPVLRARCFVAPGVLLERELDLIAMTSCLGVFARIEG